MKTIDEEIFECLKEMADKGKFFESEMAQYSIQIAFAKGAEWKERQIIDKACEWLEEHVEDFMPPTCSFHDYDTGELLYFFKNAMKRELKKGGEE